MLVTQIESEISISCMFFSSCINSLVLVAGEAELCLNRVGELPGECEFREAFKGAKHGRFLLW